MRTILLVVLLTLSFSARAQQTSVESGIEGTVVDSISGRPLAGVTLIAAGGGNPITTAPDGLFAFRNLTGGRVSVTGSKPGYAIKNLPFTLALGTRITNALFRMDPTGVISGRLTDNSGRPVVEAAVQVRALGGRALPPRAYTTNDRGEYRILDLTPGLYYVEFASSAQALQGTGFEPPPPNSFGTTLYPGVSEIVRALPVEVKSGEEIRIRDTTLMQSRPGVVRLHVTNDTGQVAEAHVFFGMAEGRQTRALLSHMAEVDVTESWRATTKEYWPSRPGTYTATAASSVAGASGATTFEFTGVDIDVNIKLEAGNGKLTGKVVLQSQEGLPAKPATDVQVALHPDAVPSTWNFPVSETDGTFDLSDMPLGRYQLRLSNLPPDFYLSSARQGDRDVLKEGLLVQSVQTHVDITLAAGRAVVQGRVTDAQNRAVHGAMVVLLPETPSPPVVYRTDRTDQNGAYQISNLIPGAYHVYAFSTRTDDSFVEPSFMKQFEDKGKLITVERRSQLSLDLKGVE